MSHSPATHHGHGHAAPTPGRWRVLVLLCLAQFMVILDVTIANVALPSIGEDLALSRATLPWVISAYTLVFGGFLLLGGRLADLIGRRTTFAWGLTLFTAASLACGLATNGTTLLAARLAQGAGAALLSPAALSIITTTFHGAERNRALGVWAAIGGTGSAVGVLLGGALTSGPGWEWAFLINVPIGAAVLAATFALVNPGPNHTNPGTHPGTDPHTERHNTPRPDWPGAILMTAMTASLIFGLVNAGSAGWGAPTTLVPLALGATLVAAFIAVERRARDPLVPIPVLTRRNVVAGNLAMLTGAGLLIAAFFLASLYLQAVAHYSAMKTGLTFLPVALGMIVAVHLCSHLLPKLGWRPIATAGMVVAAGGFFWLSRLSGGGDVLIGFVVAAAGLACMFVVATTSAMHDVDHREAGLLSGLVNTNHELGASLGIAFVAAVAGGSVETGAVAISGYENAFLACAIVSLIAAVASPVLLPAGKPSSDGPVFAH
ncbi:DHA2 family efflux MFS transporter permease subunit [Saccharothrix mutabilis subsp. mutabilis]|uniref:DHA2 family efflux MFS transporter permease subunit n=1 Tax=Saccharothrix mutabilis subsp. mutabilis TaxID=66855 RepID=A0ABP3EBY3_9PSEU